MLLKLQRTGKVSQKLAEKPRLGPHLTPVWEAFSLLHASRPPSFSGPGTLQISEIEAAARTVQYWDLEELVILIKKLDSVYIEWWTERNPQK